MAARAEDKLNHLSLRLIKVKTPGRAAYIELHLLLQLHRMNRLRWLSLLMGLTILGITGFQLYWLQESYTREKTALYINTGKTFRETIQDLQVKNLKLWETDNDTLNSEKVQIIMTEGKGPVKVTRTIKDNAVSKIRVIRDKLMDSLHNRQKKIGGGMIISLDKTTVNFNRDSANFTRKIIPGGTPPDQLFQLLYGVDSLQDSLRIQEIDSAFRIAMNEQKLNIPYSITRLDSINEEEGQGITQVSVGFAKPVTYRMEPGNTMGYLLKRISLPILFSVILLGITLLSFILLYRNIVRQQRLAALKNEFISNITHELKTPIATVGVAIEALKNFNAIRDPERTKEYLDISTNELHRLGLLVDKVLKLSMFEKKGIELKYESLNLKELVDEVLASLKLQLEKKKAGVSVIENGDMQLQGDRTHLLSVIFNLLDNALKYSNGAPVIQLGLSGKENNIILSVSDNGIGIDPAYKDKIFEKFFRVPHGDTHDAKGHGLGLSYVAQVIRKHNGTIDCQSRPGTGTTFTITLPKQSV